MEARGGGGGRDKKVLRYKIRDTEVEDAYYRIQEGQGYTIQNTRYAILLDMRYVLRDTSLQDTNTRCKIQDKQC